MNYKHGLTNKIKKCLSCKKEFVSRQESLKRKQNYCSPKCYGKSIRGKKPTKKQLETLKLGRGWNKGTKGLIKPNSGSFKKGQIMNRLEKNPSWRGGKSFEPYTLDWTETLRRSIRERDSYICKLCEKFGKDVHHIDYKKENCCPENLITLCKKCNSKVNFNRKFWTKHFYGRNKNTNN